MLSWCGASCNWQGQHRGVAVSCVSCSCSMAYGYVPYEARPRPRERSLDKSSKYSELQLALPLAGAWELGGDAGSWKTTTDVAS
eukprot:497898-Prymnesium_polylepis.1